MVKNGGRRPRPAPPCRRRWRSGSPAGRRTSPRSPGPPRSGAACGGAGSPALAADLVRRPVAPARSPSSTSGQATADLVDVVGARPGHGPDGIAQPASPSPNGPRVSSRTPRAQSAAAICFLPNALTSPSRTGPVPVPTSTAFLVDLELARAPAGRRRRRVTGPSLIRSPRRWSRRRAPGVHARIRRSTASAGSAQSTRASSTVIFGAKLTPSSCWAGPRATRPRCRRGSPPAARRRPRRAARAGRRRCRRAGCARSSRRTSGRRRAP